MWLGMELTRGALHAGVGFGSAALSWTEAEPYHRTGSKGQSSLQLPRPSRAHSRANLRRNTGRDGRVGEKPVPPAHRSTGIGVRGPRQGVGRIMPGPRVAIGAGEHPCVFAGRSAGEQPRMRHRVGRISCPGSRHPTGMPLLVLAGFGGRPTGPHTRIGSDRSALAGIPRQPVSWQADDANAARCRHPAGSVRRSSPWTRGWAVRMPHAGSVLRAAAWSGLFATGDRQPTRSPIHPSSRLIDPLPADAVDGARMPVRFRSVGAPTTRTLCRRRTSGSTVSDLAFGSGGAVHAPWLQQMARQPAAGQTGPRRAPNARSAADRHFAPLSGRSGRCCSPAGAYRHRAEPITGMPTGSEVPGAGSGSGALRGEGAPAGGQGGPTRCAETAGMRGGRKSHAAGSVVSRSYTARGRAVVPRTVRAPPPVCVTIDLRRLSGLCSPSPKQGTAAPIVWVSLFPGWVVRPRAEPTGYRTPSKGRLSCSGRRSRFATPQTDRDTPASETESRARGPETMIRLNRQAAAACPSLRPDRQVLRALAWPTPGLVGPHRSSPLPTGLNRIRSVVRSGTPPDTGTRAHRSTVERPGVPELDRARCRRYYGWIGWCRSGRRTDQRPRGSGAHAFGIRPR